VTQWEWAAVIYGPLTFGVIVAELLAATGLAPWPTISSTVKELEGLWVWAVFFVLAGLQILCLHLVWKFLPALLREIGG
jgi:hypothetical protein